jgi:hypothetical protein
MGVGIAMKTGKDEIGMVLLLGCRCRCGHEWLPRNAADKPRVCPKCKSPNWDRQKVNGGERRAGEQSGP